MLVFSAVYVSANSFVGVLCSKYISVHLSVHVIQSELLAITLTLQHIKQKCSVKHLLFVQALCSTISWITKIHQPI